MDAAAHLVLSRKESRANPAGKKILAAAFTPSLDELCIGETVHSGQLAPAIANRPTSSRLFEPRLFLRRTCYSTTRSKVEMLVYIDSSISGCVYIYISIVNIYIQDYINYKSITNRKRRLRVFSLYRV